MFNDAIYNDFLVNVIQQNLLFKQEGLLNFCQKNTKVCHFCEARSRALSGPRLFLTLFFWIQRSLCKISNKLFIWYVQSMYLLSRAVLIKSLLSLIEVQQSLLFSFLQFFLDVGLGIHLCTCSCLWLVETHSTSHEVVNLHVGSEITKMVNLETRKWAVERKKELVPVPSVCVWGVWCKYHLARHMGAVDVLLLRSCLLHFNDWQLAVKAIFNLVCVKRNVNTFKDHTNWNMLLHHIIL